MRAGPLDFPITASVFGMVKTLRGKLSYHNPATGEPEVRGWWGGKGWGARSQQGLKMCLRGLVGELTLGASAPLALP